MTKESPHAAKRRAACRRAHGGVKGRRGRAAEPAARGQSQPRPLRGRRAEGRRADTPLHLFADWPGHNPNAAAIVQALAASGADLDAPAVNMWHREAPLHWAASNDDVALIDALLDAGADIEHAGSSIDGGPPCRVPSVMDNGLPRGGWSSAAPGPLSGTKRRWG
jgi:hypothetical protein